MTIKELKNIIENLMDDTIILIKDSDISETETIEFQIHSDGSSHLIFSASE